MTESRTPVDIVDVFAARPLEGNPLAVVRVSAMPDLALRQAIARETNLSETTFVLDAPDADGAFETRIHTPAQELPFAGHPVLGTAWIVREHLAARAAEVVLSVPAGRIPVRFESDSRDEPLWLRAPATQIEDGPDAAQVAEALGVSVDALSDARSDEWVPSARLDNGPVFLVAGVQTVETLAGLQPPSEALRALLSAHRAVGMLIVAPGEARGVDLATRMFFVADGVREDPATGSASAALGALLGSHGRFGRVRILQGLEMQRPSHITVDIAADAIEVGGTVRSVIRGEFQLPV